LPKDGPATIGIHGNSTWQVKPLAALKCKKIFPGLSGIKNIKRHSIVNQ